MAHLNISLPDATRAIIEAEVASGAYASAGDYVDDLIQHDQEQKKALKQGFAMDKSEAGKDTEEELLARQKKLFEQYPTLSALFSQPPFGEMDLELPEGVRCPVRDVEL